MARISLGTAARDVLAEAARYALRQGVGFLRRP
jgi:hypothetical protein